MLFPILSFLPTLFRALGTTEPFAFAFLSGFVLRISLTVEGVGPIVFIDERQVTGGRVYMILPDVEGSVERLLASVSALTLRACSSDGRTIG